MQAGNRLNRLDFRPPRRPAASRRCLL